MPFQQEAFFEMPDNCIIGQALLWIDHQEVPIPDDHFVAMGEIPRIYRDLAGARKSLFLALRSGKLRANGIFWGEGPLDDRAVNIPPTQWIWDNVEWVNAIYGPTLSTPHWQKDNAGRYEFIEVNTNALFALYPRELGHDTNETATATTAGLRARSRRTSRTKAIFLGRVLCSDSGYGTSGCSPEDSGRARATYACMVPSTLGQGTWPIHCPPKNRPDLQRAHKGSPRVRTRIRIADLF